MNEPLYLEVSTILIISYQQNIFFNNFIVTNLDNLIKCKKMN